MSRQEITVDFDKLTITDDFVFSTTMRRNKDLCIGILERILGVKIRDIVYVGTQETMEFSRQHKGVRLDVYVEDDANTVYDIEMQTTMDPDLEKRSRYYHGMMDLSQTEKGILYRNLKKSYVIFICLADPFNQGRAIYHFAKRCEECPDLVLGDETSTVFVNANGNKEGLSKEFISLLEYLSNGIIGDSFIDTLEQRVSDVVHDKGWRAEYMTLEMKFREYEEKGIEQGIEQGIELNNKLFSILLKQGRTEDAIKATEDKAYCNQLMREYKLLENH